MKHRLLQIALLGNPILWKKAKSVRDIKNEKVQKLIDSMIKTVMEVDGVGLAAPQVNESFQIFIMASHPNPRYPKAPKMKPTAIINPKIIKLSKTQEKAWEGCLSIPGMRGFISRSAEIQVEYVTREDRKIKTVYKDFLARIFQHEFDHLQGLTFLDRVSSGRDLMNEKEWRKAIE